MDKSKILEFKKIDKVKIETIESFLKRGGKIQVLKPKGLRTKKAA